MDFDLVEGNLFIGSRRAVQGFILQHQKMVVHVLSVESDGLHNVPHEVVHLHVQVDDLENADLLSYFDAMNVFISEGLQKGVVFVHCRHGVSRSAATCAAFLMKRHHIGAEEAVRRVRERRASVSPNRGFVRQLELYGRLGLTTSLGQREYRLFRLRAAARAITADASQLCSTAAPLLLPDAGMSCRGAIYRCRRCRTALFSEQSVVGDGVIQEPEQSLRLLPLDWMAEVTKATTGKLKCYRCSSKLGVFSWLPDSRHNTALFGELEADFEPIFAVTPSRVDKCMMHARS